MLQHCCVCRSETLLWAKRSRSPVLAGLLLLAGFLVAGCRPPEAAPTFNQNVTKETFAKIKPGMSRWEVKDLLGDSGQLVSSQGTRQVRDGKVSEQATEVFVWQNGQASITATFENDRVVNKEAHALP